MVVSPFWSSVEPNWECGDVKPACPSSFYSKQLKADLLPGTFVLFSSRNNHNGVGVGRIVCIAADEDRATRNQVMSDSRSPHSRVQVNVFKRFTEFETTTASILRPEFINENHLRHLPGVVQMEEIQLISGEDIMNLAFVFTPTALKDSCNLFFTCQGMAIAFIVRSRYQEVGLELPMLTEVPPDHCLPFPSSYIGSGYYDCYPRRMWNSVICLKLEMTKLLGRYSNLQGLYCKEACRLSNFTPETWGFLRWQFHDIFEDADCGMSTRIHCHRLTETWFSG